MALEDSREQTMSKYLIDRIRQLPNVEVKTNHTLIDEKGFILAGNDLKKNGRVGHNWPLQRDPYMPRDQ